MGWQDLLDSQRAEWGNTLGKEAVADKRHKQRVRQAAQVKVSEGAQKVATALLCGVRRARVFREAAGDTPAAAPPSSRSRRRSRRHPASLGAPPDADDDVPQAEPRPISRNSFHRLSSFAPAPPPSCFTGGESSALRVSATPVPPASSALSPTRRAEPPQGASFMPIYIQPSACGADARLPSDDVKPPPRQGGSAADELPKCRMSGDGGAQGVAAAPPPPPTPVPPDAEADVVRVPVPIPSARRSDSLLRVAAPPSLPVSPVGALRKPSRSPGRSMSRVSFMSTDEAPSPAAPFAPRWGAHSPPKCRASVTVSVSSVDGGEDANTDDDCITLRWSPRSSAGWGGLDEEEEEVGSGSGSVGGGGGSAGGSDSGGAERGGVDIGIRVERGAPPPRAAPGVRGGSGNPQMSFGSAAMSERDCEAAAEKYIRCVISSVGHHIARHPAAGGTSTSTATTSRLPADPPEAPQGTEPQQQQQQQTASSSSTLDPTSLYFTPEHLSPRGGQRGPASAALRAGGPGVMGGALPVELLDIIFRGGHALAKLKHESELVHGEVRRHFAARREWDAVGAMMQHTGGIRVPSYAMRKLERFHVAIQLPPSAHVPLHRWAVRGRAAVALRRSILERYHHSLSCRTLKVWFFAARAQAFRTHQLLNMVFYTMRGVVRVKKHRARPAMMDLRDHENVTSALTTSRSAPGLTQVFEEWRRCVRRVHALRKRVLFQHRQRRAQAGGPFAMRQKQVLQRAFGCLAVSNEVKKLRHSQADAADRFCDRAILAAWFGALRYRLELRDASHRFCSSLTTSAFRRWYYEFYKRAESRRLSCVAQQRRRIHLVHSSWKAWRERYLVRAVLYTNHAARTVPSHRFAMMWPALLIAGDERAFAVRVWCRWKRLHHRRRIYLQCLRHSAVLHTESVLRTHLAAWRSLTGGVVHCPRQDEECRNYAQVLYQVRQCRKKGEVVPVRFAMRLVGMRRQEPVASPAHAFFLISHIFRLARKAVLALQQQENDSQDDSDRRTRSESIAPDNPRKGAPPYGSLSHALMLQRVPATRAVAHRLASTADEKAARVVEFGHRRAKALSAAQDAVVQMGAGAMVERARQMILSAVLCGRDFAARAQLSFRKTEAYLLEGRLHRQLALAAHVYSADSDGEEEAPHGGRAGQATPALSPIEVPLPTPPEAAAAAVPDSMWGSETALLPARARVPAAPLSSQWYPSASVQAACAARLVVPVPNRQAGVPAVQRCKQVDGVFAPERTSFAPPGLHMSGGQPHARE